MVGFNSAIPGLGYTVVGTETFTQEIQITAGSVQEIMFRVFTSAGWSRPIWYGTTELFGFGGTNKGSVPATLNTWLGLNFTPSDLGLVAGAVITGLAWGIWRTAASGTVVFSDLNSSTASSSNTIPVIFPTSGTAVLKTGFIDVDQDGGSGFYALEHHDYLIHVSSIGTVPNAITLGTSPSFAYTGLVYTGGFPYFVGQDGTVYKYNATTNTLTTFASPPTGVTAPARRLVTDGASLYTMFPNSLKIGALNISNQTWTTSGIPFTSTLDSIYAAQNNLVIGGSNSIAISLSGVVGLAAVAATASSQVIATNSTDNAIKILDLKGDIWTVDQSLNGAGSPTTIATSAGDPTQALVSNPSNNIVQILTSIAGTWSSANLTVTNPKGVAMTPDGTEALVCNQSGNQVVVLTNSSGTWSVGRTLAVTSPLSVVIRAAGDQAIVTTSNGVVFLNNNGGIWSLSTSLVLTSVPQYAAIDVVNSNNTLFYAAGASGGNSTVYIFSGQALTTSYSFSGSVTSLGVINYQIVAPVSSGSLNTGYYVNGTITNSSTSSLVPTSGGPQVWTGVLPDFPNTLLIAGSSQIWQLLNIQPLTFIRDNDSAVGILSGASFTSVDLQDLNRVSSISTDTSGNIFAVTTDNDLYKITSSGSIVSGYPFLIQPETNQEAGVPLGFSKLVWFGGSLFSASSLTGGLVNITGT
jgi:hypothetical protein